MIRKYKETIETFCLSMRQLGYSGKYSILGERGILVDYPMELKQCLEKCLETYNPEKIGASFQLETKPNYGPHIRCVFKMDFEPEKGFLVREMHLRDIHTFKEETIRIYNNRQVPGCQAVTAKFPKVKPWQKHLKRRFGL